MVSRQQRQRRREMEPLPPWKAPPYRAIEMKIGEEFRERYDAPKGLPHRLFTLVIQLTGQSEDD
jgi:hypothetical protein